MTHEKLINEIGKCYERPWGTYQTVALGENYQVKIISVKPGGRLSLQMHFKRAEHWICVEGEPTVTVNDVTKTLRPNGTIDIPIEAVHRLENFTQKKASIIEVQIGSYLGEDDIVRLEDIYNRK